MPKNDGKLTVSDMSDDIIAKTRSSFLILLQTCAELLKDDVDIPSSLKAYQETVLRLTMNLPTVETETQTLASHRTDIIAAIRAYKAANAYVSLTCHWMLYNSMVTQIPEDAGDLMDGYQLFTIHLDSLMPDGPDGEPDEEYMHKFMAYIPLRMTAARYYDYVQDALRAAHGELRGEGLEDYKSLFNPPECEFGYGIGETIKQTLDEYWQADLTQYTTEQFEAVNEALERIRRRMIKTVSQVITLLDTVNALTIVQSHRNCVDEIINDPEAAELFRTFKEKSTTDEWLEIAPGFNERLDKAIDAAARKIRIDPEISIKNDEMDDLAKDWQNVNHLYYETGLDYFLKAHSDPMADGADAGEGFMDGFIAFMDDCVKSLPIKRKRFLRQHFLKYLPYPYSYEDYRDYFIKTYNGLDDRNKINMNLYVCCSDNTGQFDELFGRSEADENSNL